MLILLLQACLLSQNDWNASFDQDLDGITIFNDCDDNDATTVNDMDCDGVLTTDDCDDNDATTVNDMDCDGILTEEDCNDNDSTMPNQDSDCDGVLTTEDCDDSNTNLLEQANDGIHLSMEMEGVWGRWVFWGAPAKSVRPSTHQSVHSFQPKIVPVAP